MDVPLILTFFWTTVKDPDNLVLSIATTKVHNKYKFAMEVRIVAKIYLSCFKQSNYNFELFTFLPENGLG